MTHFIIERRARNKSGFFFDQKEYGKSSVFILLLSLSHRYSLWINRELFPLYESILFHFHFFPIPSEENPELDPKWTGWRELIHAVMHSSNRNPFSERSWLSCFGELSEILSMTYVVLKKGYLISIWSDRDCVRPAVAAEPGKVYRKDISFFSFYSTLYYISILVISISFIN